MDKLRNGWRLFKASLAVMGDHKKLLLSLMGVANHIYRCALYLYAAEGTVPAPYDRESMDQAWKFKKG